MVPSHVLLRFKSEECSLWHQVLKYEPGQFYRAHHDQNTHPDSLAGVRLFTFFIYLQAPESGGQTYFPRLNITVRFLFGLSFWRKEVEVCTRSQADASLVLAGAAKARAGAVVAQRKE